MKRRKGVTILGALCTAFVILAGAAFAVIMLVLAPMFAKEASEAKVIGEAFNFLARNKDILGAFTTFDKNDLVPNVAVFSSIGLFVIISVIWLIVDLRRDRKICFFFIILFLLATYLELIYYFAITPLQEFITKYAEKYPLLLVPVGCAALAGLASILAIALFIVDIATGRVERPETPTFIKEPTEEVNETPYEEVKDESEVEEAPVAPAPIEEAPVEEEAEEVEEEEEKVVEPQRKTAPKKVKKPQPAPKKAAPAKKAEPKKEPAKKAEAKKEAPKAEPKKDARKTQTIVLQNEDGNSYAKAYHVSRRPELNKWQVKATGSDKALKLFNTQKEAIEYADQLAKNQNVSIRVHSKEGKIRKHNG